MTAQSVVNERTSTSFKPIRISKSLSYALSAVLFGLFSIGSITNSSIFNILSLILFFACVILVDIKKSILILVALTPNNMIVSLSTNSNVRIIGLFYIVVLLRILFSNKLTLKSSFSIFAVSVLFITFIKIPISGIRDFATCFQTVAIILSWIMILAISDKDNRYNIYLAFAFGTFLMFIGMFLNKYITGETRFFALFDDANYTSVAFVALFSLSLFFYINGIHKKNNFYICIFALIGGLLTASRGFLLSVGIVLLIYILLGIVFKKTRFIFWLAILFVLIFFAMYFAKIPFVVSIYDETIGRTIMLRDTYKEGEFMDITSGRMYLWNYYLGQFSSSINQMFFGFGFNYYLAENGGLGLVAHNSFVSGLMGIGIIGTILMMISYSYIFVLGKRKSVVPFFVKATSFSILAGVLVGYFFLDGLMDIRLSMYISLFTIAYSFLSMPKNDDGDLERRKKLFI